MFNELKKYNKSSRARFHTPGHSGKNIKIDTSMDITELSFSDNLLNSNGIILETEKKIANLYNSNFALMLTSGATSGIFASLVVAQTFGKTIVVVGDAHKSVFNFAYLLGLEIIRANQDDYDFYKNKNIACVIITSPNYFGEVTNYSCWASVGKLLICDSAHGAHFPFSPLLPQLDFENSDIIITSMHKTLPVITGGACILTNSESLYKKLFHARSLTHTTSPNYMTMASIDNAIKLVSKLDYEKILEKINFFKANLTSKLTVLDTDDYTRLIICLNGISGQFYQKQLENRGIFIEMSYYDKLVLIVTPSNYKKLNLVLKVLNSLKIDTLTEKEIHLNLINTNIAGKIVVNVTLDEAIGKISAVNVGKYPPGVPSIFVGDILTAEAIYFIKSNIDNIFGVVNETILIAK